MHWWQNLRTLWPGALRQQVTRTGLAYSGAIVIVALAAVLSANNLLFLILAAMLSILAVSGFVSKLTLAGLEIDLLLPPHISARRKFRATVRLKNLKHWMPSFSIHVTGAPDGKHPSGYDGALFFPAVPGGVALEEPIDLRFPTRGRYSERTFQLTTRFPFGFAERRERVTLRQDVLQLVDRDASHALDPFTVLSRRRATRSRPRSRWSRRRTRRAAHPRTSPP